MPITILDPKNQPPATPAGTATRLPDLSGVVLGVIDNGKRNSKFVLDELTAILRSRHKIKEVVLVTKPSASLPIPQEQAAELAGRCNAVLAGIGD